MRRQIQAPMKHQVTDLFGKKKNNGFDSLNTFAKISAPGV